MPRQVRIEYPGAIYHVMARGNRRERIVIDDEDRERFEAALEEVVGKMGWVLYAYVLMGNHYHLVFKTPEPNLVMGMTWFQSTVTKRFNARHRLRGHLFSGRYKAVLVEENDYLTTLMHYVHLNPVRARLVKVSDGIESYPWSSLGDYLAPPSKRRDWVAVEPGLAHLGYEDKAGGRKKMLGVLEGLVSKSPLKRAGVVELEGAGLNATLRRGWCFGTEEFKEKMTGLLGAQIKSGRQYRAENGYDGRQLRSHDEKAAREYIRLGLDVLGIDAGELAGMPKMDVRKAMLARLVRRHTQMGLEWISNELRMGVRSSVTRAEKLLNERMKHDKNLRKQWEKIKMQQISS